MSKTIVYVDGFNLYYAVKKHNAKWLDISVLCDRLLTQNEVVTIKYFTARVRSRLGDLDIHIRQNAYLRALQSNPKIEIIFGHFLTNDKWMVQTKDAGKDSQKIKKVQVIVTEEKGSDVNIATHLLVDGFQNKYDIAAVITNDSDLKLPVEMVRSVLNKPVGIICPHEHPSRELKKVASFFKCIKAETYKECQFPDSFADSIGKVHKPKEW
ncbi:MAG: hypothetical protein A2Z20_05210 [Bdellovibrionales bacterium RBG_16_40_8]|nr:MAG: hypothetical protein A2Z20_05210 [Bdellovibrionales bacterium RBG_16_40_8]